MRWYSSAVRPCAAMSAGLTFARLAIFGPRLLFGAGSFLGARAEGFLDVFAIALESGDHRHASGSFRGNGGERNLRPGLCPPLEVSDQAGGQAAPRGRAERTFHLVLPVRPQAQAVAPPP